MSLGDVLFRHLGGSAVVQSTPASFADQLAAVERSAGSGRKAAKQVGVSEGTWRRWKAGTTRPKVVNEGKLTAAWRVVRLDTNAADRLRRGSIELEVTQSGGREHGRVRKITGSGLRLGSGTGDRVIAAYLAGDKRAAARAFIDGIGDDFYYEWFMSEEYPDEGDTGYGLNAVSAA